MKKEKELTNSEQNRKRKRNIFAAVLAVLGAATATTTGLAVYYATRPYTSTVEVTFNLNGGAITGGAKQKVIRGSKVGQLPVPYMDASANKVFDRWEDLDGNILSSNLEINTDIHLAAKYKEAGVNCHTVTMDYKGGTIEGLKGNSIKVPHDSVIASLPSPVLDGYIFLQWLDAEGNEIPPSTKITTDISVVAQYKSVSTSTYLLGGQTLINIKPGETGATLEPWTLHRGSEEIKGATWSLSAEAGAEMPKGVTIDQSGVVKWDGTTQPGNYTVTVTATKDEITGTAKFAVVCVDNTYTIESGFVSENVKVGDTGTINKEFLLKADTKYVAGVTWTATVPTITSPEVIEFKTGENKISYSKLNAGIKNVLVTASKDGKELATTYVAINVEEYAYTLGDGVTSFTIDDNAASTSTTTAFKVLQDGTPVTGGTTEWTVSSSPTIPSPAEITIANGIITCKKVPTGTYTLTVQATWTDADGKAHTTSTATVTLISKKSQTTISGDDVIKSSLKSKYTAASTTSGYTNFKWTANYVGKGTVTIPASSTGATIEVTTSYDAVGALTLTAEDAITGAKTTKDIKIEAPYTNSDKIWSLWTYDGEIWWEEENLDDLCNVNKATVEYKYLGDTESDDLPKYYFGHNAAVVNLYIGDQITSIPDNFLIGKPTGGENNWTFKSTTVIFPETSKCIEIGDCFLQDNNNFNKTVTLPTGLKTIGEGFMIGCNAFNQSLTIPNTVSLIGDLFLSDCNAFNKDLTIPASVKHVGKDFMENCNAMTSTLYVNVSANVFDAGDGVTPSTTLSSNSSAAACVTTGIKIKTPYVTEFIQKFPNRTTTPFRTLNVVATKFDKASWEEISLLAELYESGEIGDTDITSNFVKSDGTILTDLTDLDGQTHTVDIDGVTHTVKVVGTKHDNIVNEAGTLTGTKALFTFDLINVISNKTDYKKTTYKYDGGPSTNEDYTKSALYKNLVGTPVNGWTENALTMLLKSTPMLKGHIKTVQKEVSKGGTTTTKFTYNTTLFQLTLHEMNLTHTKANAEGETYSYYTGTGVPTAKTSVDGTRRRYWVSTPTNDNTGGQFGIESNQDVASPLTFGLTYADCGLSFAFCI